MDISSRAALLFLTLVVLAAAAAAGGGGGDDAAATVEVEHPLADEPYMLVAFHNKGGEEIRMLADKGTDTLSASGFANRSGHWFYVIREGRGEGKRRRGGSLPLPPLSNAEGFWSTLGALANTSDPAADDDGEQEQEQGYYMLVGMQTSGGDKIRLTVVVDQDQRYFFVTGYAKGFSSRPRWSFRDGERHRLRLPMANGSSSSHVAGGSHAEVVASDAWVIYAFIVVFVFYLVNFPSCCDH